MAVKALYISLSEQLVAEQQDMVTSLVLGVVQPRTAPAATHFSHNPLIKVSNKTFFYSWTSSTSFGRDVNLLRTSVMMSNSTTARLYY